MSEHVHDHGLSLCGNSRLRLHLFGSYGDPAAPEGWPSFAETVEATWGQSESKPRLWLVSGRGWSRQRLSESETLGPLPPSDVADQGTPRPMAKLAIAVQGMAIGQQPIIIDADQTIEVYASGVDVAALVPSGVQEVKSYRPLEVPAGELAVDDLLGVAVVGIQAPIGARTATLTQTLVAADDAAASAPVPRGAVELLVSPADPAAAGEWLWSVGDPVALGAANVVGSFAPSSESLRVPSATHVSVAADAGTRVYSLTWKISAS